MDKKKPTMDKKKLTIDKKNNLHGSSIRKWFRRKFHRIRSYHHESFSWNAWIHPQTFLIKVEIKEEIKVEIFSLPPAPHPPPWISGWVFQPKTNQKGKKNLRETSIVTQN